jgi:glutathione S-transferase
MKEVREGKEDFNMFESHAIMKYMCNVRGLDQHWYPTQPRTKEEMEIQARMDMYLDWHHANIRMGAGGYMFRKYFSGLMDKNAVWATEFAIEESWKILTRSLKQIERIWLPANSGKRFMFGDKPSIADLSLAGEVTNMVLTDYPLKENNPTIYKWLYEDMMSIAGYKEIHDRGFKILQK